MSRRRCFGEAMVCALGRALVLFSRRVFTQREIQSVCSGFAFERFGISLCRTSDPIFHRAAFMVCCMLQ